MTPQQHADHLLQVWQSRRDLPPYLRLADVDRFCPDALVDDAPSLVPDADTDEYERDLAVLRVTFGAKTDADSSLSLDAASSEAMG
jgi:hypothetical protein